MLFVAFITTFRPFSCALSDTITNQKIIYKDLPVNDPLQRQPDISLAKKILNWEPHIGRAEGMKKTFEYFQGLSNDELYKSEHKDFKNHIKK